jgi:hypothetical protein
MFELGEVVAGCSVFGLIQLMRRADRNSAPASNRKSIVDLVGNTNTNVFPRLFSSIAFRANPAIPCQSTTFSCGTGDYNTLIAANLP